MIFIDNKYTRYYYNIINSAKARIYNDGYTEKHHIIPKSLGGNNSLQNLVILTAKEHFICHHLLTKMTIGINRGKMCYAAWAMANLRTGPVEERYKINAKTYSFIKNQLSTMDKLPRTEEHKQKLRQKRSIAVREAISLRRKGASTGKRTQETKEKMSKWQKGIPKEKISCEFCSKEISQMNYKKWHGENCKRCPTYASPTKVTKTCEYCNKTLDRGNYAQHHGPKCKHKPN